VHLNYLLLFLSFVTLVMETTKHKLTPEQKKFFDGLSNYLDTKLYYYGSIQRPDYIPGKSDIDVDIFTDNENSTITKLQHYLHVKKGDFRKIVWKVRRNNKLTYGHKLKYKKDFIKAEFAIYNEKYKPYILEEHNSKVILPFYCIWILNFLKFLHYQLHILPGTYYAYLKRKTINFSFGLDDDKFVVL